NRFSGPFVFFVPVQERTRSALLDNLLDELQRRSQCMMGLSSGVEEEGRGENGHTHGGLLESIKRAMKGRSVSMETMSRLPTSLSGGGLAHLSIENCSAVDPICNPDMFPSPPSVSDFVVGSFLSADRLPQPHRFSIWFPPSSCPTLIPAPRLTEH
ncbi:hypothetical protein XENOCAPTIV_012803, partial [Xenoophorus captivus]